MMGLFLSPGASLHLTGFLSAAAGWFSANATRKGDPSKRPARQKGKKGPHPAVPPRFGESRPSVAVGYAAVVGVVILALVSFGGTTLAFSFSQLEYGVGITEHKFSFKAAEFLRRNPVQGKMFNFFDIGGVLHRPAHPRASTILSRRAHNQQVFMEHQAVTGGGPGGGRGIDKEGMTY